MNEIFYYYLFPVVVYVHYSTVWHSSVHPFFFKFWDLYICEMAEATSFKFGVHIHCKKYCCVSAPWLDSHSHKSHSNSSDKIRVLMREYRDFLFETFYNCNACC